MELDEAIDIDQRHHIQYKIEYATHPWTHTTGQQREHQGKHIYIEKEFGKQVLVQMCSTNIRQCRPGAYTSKDIHEHKKRGIATQRFAHERHESAHNL